MFVEENENPDFNVRQLDTSEGHSDCIDKTSAALRLYILVRKASTVNTDESSGFGIPKRGRR